MITDIARMLQAQEPNSDAGHRARFAIIIEKSFFRSATSFEEYSDRGTLTTRLQALIDTARAQQQQQAGPAPAAKRAKTAPALTTAERAAVLRAIAELDRKSSQKAVRKSAERILGLPDGSLDAKKAAVKELCAEEMRRLEQQRPPRRSGRLEK